MDRQRRALILGTLAGQVDAMTSLQNAGWEVHACGHEAAGPGVDAADAFHLVDLLDVEAVVALCEKERIDLCYSVGSDIAMPTVARVNERLGLPGFHDVETTEILHRKPLLRSFLDEHNLSPVRSRAVRSAGEGVGFDLPAIVKPSDSQGQRGITIVRDEDAMPEAIEMAVAASRSGVAIIEEFLDGPEVSAHVVVVNGRIELIIPSDRIVWDGPMVGIPAAHVVPASFLTAATTSAVEDLIGNVVAALGVVNGPLYFQMILTADGPRIVEIAPRLDGCHLWRLLLAHTGFDLMAALFTLLADGEWVGPEPWSDTPSHTLGFFLGDPAQPFAPEAHPAPGGGEIAHLELQVEPGERPRAINDVVARLGYWIREDD